MLLDGWIKQFSFSNQQARLPGLRRPGVLGKLLAVEEFIIRCGGDPNLRIFVCF